MMQQFLQQQNINNNSKTESEYKHDSKHLYEPTNTCIKSDDNLPNDKPAANVLDLITHPESHNSQKTASSTVPKLDRKNGLIFKAKFMDYLQTLGLKNVVMHLRMLQINAVKSDKKEVDHQNKVKLLRDDTNSRTKWSEAYTQLKSCLSNELYQEMVIGDSAQKDDFFDLWDKVCLILGSNGTDSEANRKMNLWSSLKLTDGQTLTNLLSKMDDISSSVNTIKGLEIYGDQHKISKLTLALKGYPRYVYICQDFMSNMKSMTWDQAKVKVKLHMPTDDNGLETGNKKSETVDEASEGFAHQSSKAPRNTEANNRNNYDESKFCSFCQRNGHDISVCRSKTYTGLSNPNNQCRMWVMEGKCTWKTNPRNKTKGDCKFQHSPHVRNTKQWDKNKRIPAPSANNVTIDNNNNNIDNLKETVLQQLLNKLDNNTTPVSPSSNAVMLQQLLDKLDNNTTPVSSSNAVSTTPTPTITNTTTNNSTNSFTSDRDGMIHLLQSSGFSGNASVFAPLSDILEEEEEDYVDNHDGKYDDDWTITTCTSDDDEDEDMPELADSESDSDTDEEYAPQATRIPNKPTNTNVETTTTHNKENNNITCEGIFLFSWVLCLYNLILIFANSEPTGKAKLGQANVGHSAPTKGTKHVILDTGCTDSTTNNTNWLTNITSTLINMATADNTKRTATKKGTYTLKGVTIPFILVPEFNKTLVSWTDLASMGMTGTLGATSIDIFNADGTHWTSATLSSDKLWHFIELERALKIQAYN